MIFAVLPVPCHVSAVFVVRTLLDRKIVASAVHINSILNQPQQHGVDIYQELVVAILCQLNLDRNERCIRSITTSGIFTRHIGLIAISCEQANRHFVDEPVQSNGLVVLPGVAGRFVSFPCLVHVGEIVCCVCMRICRRCCVFGGCRDVVTCRCRNGIACAPGAIIQIGIRYPTKQFVEPQRTAKLKSVQQSEYPGAHIKHISRQRADIKIVKPKIIVTKHDLQRSSSFVAFLYLRVCGDDIKNQHHIIDGHANFRPIHVFAPLSTHILVRARNGCRSFSVNCHGVP